MKCYVGAVTILDSVGIFFEGWGWLVQLFESYITRLYMIMQDGHGIRYYKFEAEIQRDG